jgi:transcriptional regulator with XRE-family HTH domain
METIGSRLRAARKGKGWTQENLADEAGIGIATVRRIEQKGFEPRLSTARKLAEVLRIRPEWLIFGEEPKTERGGE